MYSGLFSRYSCVCCQIHTSQQPCDKVIVVIIIIIKHLFFISHSLNSMRIVSYLIIAATLWDRYYCPLFPDEETEVSGDSATHLRSQL